MRGNPLAALLVLLMALAAGWALSRLPRLGATRVPPSGSPLRYAPGVGASAVGASLMFAGLAAIFLRANRGPLRIALGIVAAALAVAAVAAGVRTLLLRVEWDAAGVGRIIGPLAARIPWSAIRTVRATKNRRSIVLCTAVNEIVVPTALVGFGHFAGRVLVSLPREIIESSAYAILSDAAAARQPASMEPDRKR